MKHAVRLGPALASQLGSPREWGLPTGMYVGKVFHSNKRSSVSCILPGKQPGMCDVEGRYLVRVATNEETWVPASWRRAMAHYARDWPWSAQLQNLVLGKPLFPVALTLPDGQTWAQHVEAIAQSAGVAGEAIRDFDRLVELGHTPENATLHTFYCHNLLPRDRRE